jgi:hypothetical protein
MNRIANVLAVFGLLLMLGACGPKYTVMRSNVAHKDVIAQSKQSIILPPNVEVNEEDAGGKFKRMHDYEYQLEDTIIDVLQEALREKNFVVKPVTRKDIHSFKASRKVSIFRENFQEEINTLYNPTLWTEEKAFAIENKVNAEIKDFQKQTNADLLLFVEYYGKIKTKGACSKAMAADVGIAALTVLSGGTYHKPYNPKDEPEYVEIRLALVDAKDYRILWSSKNWAGYSSWFSSSKDIQKTDRKRLKALFDAMLKDLPDK